MSRLVCGLGGIGILLLALTWPQMWSAPSNTLVSTVSGFMTAALITFGAYLVFYGLTGDWLHRLTKRRRKS